ncbi:MAG: hypothetical protein WB799_09440 [Candidatus Sulfotelmatobacter sp.]
MLAALAAMPAALHVSALAEVKPDSIPLSKDVWTSLQGAAFEVTSGSTRQMLTLVEVEDFPESAQPEPGSFAVGPAKRRPTPPLTAFSLRFYGGLKQLKQGTYSFENEKTGKFSLFIVPGKNPFFYHAVFNRLQ